MSLQFRFNLILGSLLAGFCAVLMLLNRFAHQAELRYQEEYLADQSIFLNHWLNTDARSWVQASRDLADDERVKIVLTGEAGSLPDNPQIFTGTPDAGVAVLNAQGSLLAATLGKLDWDRAAFLQSGRTFVETLKIEGGWFYVRIGEALFQICYSPIGVADDRSPAGWLALSRPWDRAQLNYLGTLSGATIKAVSDAALLEESSPRRTVLQTLRDWQGIQVCTLVMEVLPPNTQDVFAEAILPTLLLLAFGLLVILALAISLQKWVLGPLHLVQQSLSSGEIAPIEPLRNRRNELGGVAGLLATSIEQRKALHESEANLQNALEERIRLGRDLHDSVIQSLYATGMGLAVIKGRLTDAQKDVAAKLEQSRAALNETILDLRNFITGLEPEALKQQTFTEAVTHLLEFTNDMRPVKTTCEIDDDLAAQLTISQRANILQITREALSNALRHGAATEITISLRATTDHAEFEIRDNGRGFDPKSNPVNGGHGLENLAGRARDIGARITVDSEPGQGTRMTLSLPLPRKPS